MQKNYNKQVHTSLIINSQNSSSNTRMFQVSIRQVHLIQNQLQDEKSKTFIQGAKLLSTYRKNRTTFFRTFELFQKLQPSKFTESCFACKGLAVFIVSWI